jgi:hypothetical protein
MIRNQFYGLSDQIARHNIEEFGNFEHMLPSLFQQYHLKDWKLPKEGVFKKSVNVKQQGFSLVKGVVNAEAFDTS